MQTKSKAVHTGKLYLIPVDIGNKDLDRSIPAFNRRLIPTIQLFGCENIKTARRFLINCGIPSPIPHTVELIEIRNDDESEPYEHIIQRLLNGSNAGYLSEAGNPCIADPGERLVSMAHRHNIDVIPLVGPSSILLALIASGLNGERFTFNGYLNRDKNVRIQEIRYLVSSAQSGTTQIFMETPYRNDQLLEDVLKTCPDDLLITVAADIGTDTEYIKTQNVSAWRKKKPNLSKHPTIFLMGKGF